MENIENSNLIRRVRKTVITGIVFSVLYTVAMVAMMDSGGNEAFVVLFIMPLLFALGQFLIWAGGKVRSVYVTAIGASHSYVCLAYCVPVFFVHRGGIRQMLIMALCCIYVDLVLFTSYAALARCKNLKLPKDQSNIPGQSRISRGWVLTAAVMILVTMATITSISINLHVTRRTRQRLENLGISSSLVMTDFQLGLDNWNYKIHFKATGNDIGLFHVFWMLGSEEEYYLSSPSEKLTYEQLDNHIRNPIRTTSE
jgi:hypothetical protein